MKQLVKINEVKENPTNPRTIKDYKFAKLVKSIKDFPDMLEKRPIVVDESMIVLGGNMRLKACKEAGLKEIWIDVAEGWTEEQKKEFIIKDNVGYGEWDWDILANEWDIETLNDWGLDTFIQAHEANDMTEDDLDLSEEFDPVGIASGLRRVHLVFDGDEEAISFLNAKEIKFEKKGAAWIANMSTRYI